MGPSPTPAEDGSSLNVGSQAWDEKLAATLIWVRTVCGGDLVVLEDLGLSYLQFWQIKQYPGKQR